MTSLLSFSQKEFNLPKTREIIITSGDSLVRAHVLYEAQKQIRTNNDAIYYWFRANQIKRNQGRFSGKLLYGEYSVYDASDNLITIGNFKKGMRKGEWVRWYSNGNIKSIYHWRKGIKHGRFKIFSENGENVEKGRYRKGKLKFKKVNNKEEEQFNKVKYVKMKEVPDTSKKEIRKRRGNSSWFKLKKKEKKPQLIGKSERGRAKKKYKERKEDKKNSFTWFKRIFKGKSKKE